jgi:UDP-N-acetylmuramate: L-alanyl-gamma-D-glutamyl-meso-diaminopimelate ligase
MHVLKQQGMSFDYMVGAAVKDFDTAVKLSNEAPIIILEGDEYLASPLHLESKFMFYAPHLSIVSGVAWDHINVFPVYKDYVHQFAKLFSITSDRIVYFEGDSELQQIAKDYKGSANLISYNSPSFNVDNEKTFVKVDDNIYPLQVFGEHNLQNIEAAREACAYLGVNKDAFYKAIGSFEGAANRLQKLAEKGNTIVFKDFAHSPSKLKATVKAVRSQYPERKIIAIMELHTFSSLNKAFWEQYKDSMDDANDAVVFIDSETLRLKNMQIENVEELPKHFNKGTLVVIQQKEDLEKYLLNQHYENTVLLLMTSGTFGGLSISNLIEAIFES